MSKNKRWKRQAKRIKGICENRTGCIRPNTCPMAGYPCWDITLVDYEEYSVQYHPKGLSIRDLEKLCKNK